MTASEHPTTQGGLLRGRVTLVVLLSGALALAAGDQTIAGAVAVDIEQRLHVQNTQIGLLVTAASLMGALTTLPFGLLADRVPRVRLLAGCALAWSVAVGLAGAATGYTMLLLAQILLGAGIGAATPVVASLTGDLFPPAERGRIYGFILAGEFGGAAAGLLVAGLIGAAWSWRGAYWVLAVPGPILAVALLRLLPEPVRGGTMHAAPTTAEPDRGNLAELVRRHEVLPRDAQVLTHDPTERPMTWAIRYVLGIPTNVLLIISSALAYYYVAGMQTFAVVYLRGRFDLNQGLGTVFLVVIGLGVIAGILVTGPLSDRVVARGYLAGRPVIGGLACLFAVAFFVPGFFITGLAIALPLLFLGSAGVGGANPPLDAARLDIMHSRLWGRAESVRTFLQTLLKSSAPLVFGWLSVVLSPAGVDPQRLQGGGAVGLDRAFLVMLVTLAVAGVVLLLVARRTYPRDVATALASEEATS